MRRSGMPTACEARMNATLRKHLAWETPLVARSPRTADEALGLVEVQG